MKKILIFSLLALLVLASSFTNPSIVNADVDEKDIIQPQYVPYCPRNADGLGRHYDNGSTTVKAKIDGLTVNVRQFDCICGATVFESDYKYCHFYPQDATWTSTPGFPYTPGSIQYWDVHVTHPGDPIEWNIPF